MGKRIIILGAGGIAKVFHDALQASGYTVVGFLDDNPALVGTEVLGLPVLGATSKAAELTDIDGAVVGIGDNRARKTLYNRLHAWGVPVVNAIHPAAIISPHATLGGGVAVFPTAIVEAGVRVGNNVLVNTACVLAHDVQVQDHAHVAIGSMLAGGVEIGEGCFLGAGAIVIPYKKVGNWSIVGAGAVVTADLPDHVTAVGVPAKIIKRHEEE